MSTLLCSRIQTQRGLQHHTPLVPFFILLFKCCSSGLVFNLLSFYFHLYITYLNCYFLHFIIICYVADKVFAPTCLTQKVYEEGAKDVALSALSGINGNLFSTNCYCIRISFSLFRLRSCYRFIQQFHFFFLFLQQQFLPMVISIRYFCKTTDEYICWILSRNISLKNYLWTTKFHRLKFPTSILPTNLNPSKILNY